MIVSILYVRDCEIRVMGEEGYVRLLARLRAGKGDGEIENSTR